MTDRKPSFTRESINRLSRIHDRFYSVMEIAKEIGVSADTVYKSYLPAGAPHIRDKSGSIRIHGLTFKEWVLNGSKIEQPRRDLKEVEILKTTDTVKLVDYDSGRLLLILDLWGSKATLSLILPRIIKEKISAEVM